MKKFLKGFLLVFVASLLVISVQASNEISWYCKRTKDHSQPLLDSNLEIIDKYGVIWIDKSHSRMDEEKVVYLTFDAGYENGNVEKILDILDSENVRGSFFVLENILLKNHDLISKMIDGGHMVLNHTAKHKNMARIASKEEFQSELRALEEIYEREYGATMRKIYRPPEGKFNENNLKWASELGYKTVMWSFAYADWDNGRQMSPERAKEKIISNLHNGEIMLLHPTSSTNAKIMRDLIKELKEKGFRFGTIDELC